MASEGMLASGMTMIAPIVPIIHGRSLGSAPVAAGVIAPPRRQ
jgi:hypothetical protein